MSAGTPQARPPRGQSARWVHELLTIFFSDSQSSQPVLIMEEWLELLEWEVDTDAQRRLMELKRSRREYGMNANTGASRRDEHIRVSV